MAFGVASLAAFAYGVFFSGLLGALVGALASLAGVWLTQRKGDERDRTNYARAIRDNRQARLRAGYVQAVSAAQEAEEIVNELIVAPANEAGRRFEAAVRAMHDA